MMETKTLFDPCFFFSIVFPYLETHIHVVPHLVVIVPAYTAALHTKGPELKPQKYHIGGSLFAWRKKKCGIRK